jgi:hypothetical protein
VWDFLGGAFHGLVGGWLGAVGCELSLPESSELESVEGVGACVDVGIGVGVGVGVGVEAGAGVGVGVGVGTAGVGVVG